MNCDVTKVFENNALEGPTRLRCMLSYSPAAERMHSSTGKLQRDRESLIKLGGGKRKRMATTVNGGLPLLSSPAVKETSGLVSELCRQFYTLGWVSGTGGSITMKVHEDSIPKQQQLIVMSPSGIPKLELRFLSLKVYFFANNLFLISVYWR